MVISHRHRYLYLELPLTGSTAIRSELIELYDGEPILRRHSVYDQFLEQASDDEKTYFVFSNMRHPVDRAVSEYFKYRTDHKSRFSRAGQNSVSRRQLHKFLWIQEHDADFSTFFRRFYRLPFDDWSSLYHDRLDYMIRFENLNEDFGRALQLLDIERQRELPQRNKTNARDRDFFQYFDERARRHAAWVFGPYMEKWGYEFPAEWGVKASPRSSRVLHALLAPVWRTYWRRLRFRDNLGGRVLHAYLGWKPRAPRTDS
jgi:hypothetical protein